MKDILTIAAFHFPFMVFHTQSKNNNSTIQGKMLLIKFHVQFSH